MGEHHALGKSRGAARVRQRHQILPRVDAHGGRLRPRLEEVGEGSGALRGSEDEDLLDRALLRGFLRLVEERRHRHEEACAGVRELLGQLVRGIERIGGGIDAADRGHREKDHRVLRHIGAVDGEDVALLESPLGEAGRRLAHAIRELAIGERPPRRPVDERRLVTEPGRVAQDELGDRHLGNGDVGAGALHDHRGLLEVSGIEAVGDCATVSRISGARRRRVRCPSCRRRSGIFWIHWYRRDGSRSRRMATGR